MDKLDFRIATLGETTVDSPIQFSKLPISLVNLVSRSKIHWVTRLIVKLTTESLSR